MAGMEKENGLHIGMWKLHRPEGVSEEEDDFCLIGEMASSWRIPLGVISRAGSRCGLVRGS